MKGNSLPRHACHWDGCERECPPAMWGCRQHWFTLPKFLRDQVWRAYVPGQEVTKTPSQRYLLVAGMVQKWIAYYKAGKKLNEQEFLQHLGLARGQQ